MKKALYVIIAMTVCLLFWYVVVNPHDNSTVALNPEPARMEVGMNLSSVNYWMPGMPFVDIAKASMPWVTQNIKNVPGGKNSWDTHVIDSIPLDGDGYPLCLPVSIKKTEAPQIVATLMCREIQGRYPAGRYTCLYDGQGEIGFYFDAEIIHSEPGRIEIDVTPSLEGNGILMKILHSQKGDHIRNIRVVMPGHETTYKTRPFNPLFVDRLKPFKVIRFMDWQRTNDSHEKTWSRRTGISSYTQASSHGVALEYMIDLCNLVGADPWFCMPHQTDEDYIRQFAVMTRNRLRPENKIYIEYSNEVWNSMFPQYTWVEENARTGSHFEKYAYLARRSFNIWHEVFGDRKDRVIRVVSGQQASPRVIQGIIDFLGPGGMDAMATSAYFGPGSHGYDKLRRLGARAKASDVMNLVVDNMRIYEIPAIKRHASIASENHLRYITYEAGQSVCPYPLGSSPAYSQALWDAQKTPDMYRVYREFMGACRAMNIDLFMAFSFVTAQDTKYGSWGHLSRLDQPIDSAPKYRALLDEMDIEYPTKE